MNERDARRILAASLVIAAVLRLWGIWFGLPHVQARPDETVAAGRAVAILRGDLNPHFFHWPSLHLYALAALYGVGETVTRLTGWSGEALPFSWYALIGRGYVALAGILTVPVLFRLSRLVAGPGVAAMAALLLAVAPLHVRDSHFAMTDVPMTLLVMVSLLLLVEGTTRFEEAWRVGDGRGRWRALGRLAGAGLVGGLAASTKYNGGAVAAAGLGAQAWLAMSLGPRRRLALWTPIAVVAACLAAGFLAGTPYAILDFRQFRTDLLFDFSHLSQGHGPVLGRGWLYHLRFSLPLALGLPLFLAGLVGLPLVAWRHPRAAFVLGGFAAMFYWSIGSGYTVFVRYIMPLVPLWCFSAAVAAGAVARLAARRFDWRPAWPAASLAAVMLAPSLAGSVGLDLLLPRTDTRVLAARWLTRGLPPESTLHETGQEYVEIDIRSPRLHRWYYDPKTGHFAGATPEMLPQWIVIHEHPIAEYTPVPGSIARLARERYRLVKTFAATRPGSRPEDYDLQDAFFLPLRNLGEVIRPGTNISVYARRDLDGPVR